MLDAFPIYHWFHNGNPYSGAEGGMRYVITPIKVPDPSDESGKKKREALCAEVWPGPWSIEHTAEEKIETQLFDGDQAGLDKAVAWLHERYTAEADRWTDIPSILDCEPGPLTTDEHLLHTAAGVHQSSAAAWTRPSRCTALSWCSPLHRRNCSPARSSPTGAAAAS